MALSYGFYNSVANDRMYDAVDMSKIFDGIIEDGVFASIGDKLMVSATTGLVVKVGTGRAWFDHTWSYNDADVSFTLDIADAILKRWDAVVLEINSDVAVRANTLKVIKGTPASSPVKPTMQHTSTLNQYALAYVYIGAGVATITQSMITNMVGSSATPFVTGPLSIIDTDEILVQWQSEFQLWFDAMKGQLTTDAAGNLQAEIDAIVGDLNPPSITLLALKTHDHVGGDGNQIPLGGLAPNSVGPTEIINRDRTIFIPASAMYAYGCGVRLYESGLAYSQPHGSSTAVLYGGFRVPKDYVAGGTLEFSLLFTVDTQNLIDNAYVKFNYMVRAVAESVDASNLLSAYQTIGPFDSSKVNKVATWVLKNITGAIIDDFIPFYITRLGDNVQDAYPRPLDIYGVTIRYAADS